jgi:hypothetical protein
MVVGLPDGHATGRNCFMFPQTVTLRLSLCPAQNGIEVSSIHPLFKTNTSDFQISLDGKRILIVKDVGNVKPFCHQSDHQLAWCIEKEMKFRQ